MEFCKYEEIKDNLKNFSNEIKNHIYNLEKYNEIFGSKIYLESLDLNQSYILRDIILPFLYERQDIFLSTIYEYREFSIKFLNKVFIYRDKINLETLHRIYTKLWMSAKYLLDESEEGNYILEPRIKVAIKKNVLYIEIYESKI